MTYLTTLGQMLDEFLNAILGGERNQTISTRAAEAKIRREIGGCLMCWWLHQTLRQHHCRRTLAGESMSGFAMASAGLQLALLFAAVFYGVPFLLRWML